MRVFVLGHKGMLGAYVYAWLKEQKYDVVGIGRDRVDAAQIDMNYLLQEFIGEPEDVFINCIGAIKPQVDKLGPLNAIKVNSIFPYILSEFCDEYAIKLIHITTDCVYSGKKGNYSESDKPDATDIYGLTKAAGEPRNCSVIRTSIIGEEVLNGRSLIEWVKSMSGKTIYGFTNHFWNGVTCLQLAKAIDQIIKQNDFWNGNRHYFSNDPISKAVLVKFLAQKYCKNVIFTTSEAAERTDRTLSSNYSDPFGHPEYRMPDIKTMIEEQKKFYNILRLHYVSE